MIMKIAILGTRGIPSNYGGFESFAEELSSRLVKKGHEVIVYCRKGNSSYNQNFYKGVKLIILPTIRHKYFDTVAHTFLSVWHVSFSDVEIVYICNVINAIFAVVPMIFGKKVIINVDGLEWKRTKWNKIGKIAYRISERIATVFSHIIISDSKAIQAYYKERFNKDTYFVPYGAERKTVDKAEEILKGLALKPRKYFLYVSRLEPENNAHLFIKAYEQVKTDYPLVIVGSAPYSHAYIKQLKTTKDKRIRFLGPIYGNGYYALQENAYVYFHGNEVGGTNPALLEAMVYGNCIIANGVPFNREVLGEAGICFKESDVKDLIDKINFTIQHPEQLDIYRHRAIERVKNYYNWDDVVQKYESLFRMLL